MFFLLALIITVIFSSPLLIWLTFIRPYCFRHGQAYTPGALIWVTFWIDWQNARELAKRNEDRRVLVACAFFFCVQSIYTLLFFMALMGKIF